MKRIYLDHNATTPLHPEVIKTLKKHLKHFSNPSGLYKSARENKEFIEQARENIAKQIKASPEQIIFNSGASEGNNQIIYSCFEKQLKKQKNQHLLLSEIEHSSLIKTTQEYENLGLKTNYIKILKNGIIDLNHLKKSLTKETQLISVMAANNETGIVQPLKEIIKIGKDKKILIHTDAVQALGKIPFDIKTYDVDIATFSSHKIGGPKGIGFLYIKNPSNISSLIKGPSQEKYLRAGTENSLAIAGLNEAINQLNPEKYTSHCQQLKQILKSNISSLNPIYFDHPSQNLAGTLYLAFKNTNGHSLAMRLDLEGIEVSTGSACSVGAIELSPVLKAMGTSDKINQSAIRISMAQSTTIEEINKLSKILKGIIK